MSDLDSVCSQICPLWPASAFCRRHMALTLERFKLVIPKRTAVWSLLFKNAASFSKMKIRNTCISSHSSLFIIWNSLLPSKRVVVGGGYWYYYCTPQTGAAWVIDMLLTPKRLACLSPLPSSDSFSLLWCCGVVGNWIIGSITQLGH